MQYMCVCALVHVRVCVGEGERQKGLSATSNVTLIILRVAFINVEWELVLFHGSSIKKFWMESLSDGKCYFTSVFAGIIFRFLKKLYDTFS